MFLDTSGLFCFHHKAEPQHAEAAQLFAGARYRLTHSYVLAELVALAPARRIPRLPVLAFELELRQNPEVEVVCVDRGLHANSADLLRRRPDKDWSLCDAVSFLLMEMHGIREALTTDHHFEQAGYVRLLKP